jgi:hypothetical protein
LQREEFARGRVENSSRWAEEDFILRRPVG